MRMSFFFPKSEAGRPAWKQHLRKLVAVAILLAGMGWVASRHWNRPTRNAVSVQIRLAPEVFREDGELVVFIDDDRGETVWTFRGRLSEPFREFEPLLVPGRYEVLAQWRSGKEKATSVKVGFESPGPIVKIIIPGS